MFLFMLLNVSCSILTCRSYKTGYVWHDLSDDDLIVPVNGQEYILKGSEIFEDNTSGSSNSSCLISCLD